MESLDPQTCRKARLSRDTRFDGEFFLAVTSTGIYCRPVCPARPPRESNVRYYRTAAEASQKGFRPCLRCRPESAPSSPAWQGTSSTISRAMRLINEGALNQQSMEQFATRLGVGERYLRKLFRAQVGVSPNAVAQTQRLHFAHKLLAETNLALTDIAFASGFGSVRRFNSATLDKFGRTPGELRRGRKPAKLRKGTIELQLSYRPPYDWAAMLDFHRRHALAGIEEIRGNAYQRSFQLSGQAGQMCIFPHSSRNALCLQLSLPDTQNLVGVVARVRQMFDLDANPENIAVSLGKDPILAKLLDQSPGIRSPLHWSAFESCIRAVVGQQISVAAARKVCTRLVESCDNQYIRNGETQLLFPTPRQLRSLNDDALPMPDRRKQTLRSVCEFFENRGTGAVENCGEDLLKLAGIGPWTCAMVAMRGFGDPDIFPPGDLALIRALEAQDPEFDSSLEPYWQEWRPWRSYAANLLWRSLSS
jgi:AraC family transcriptional regulator of adaptative response / DNA-3-methyladenine glycosylase II